MYGGMLLPSVGALALLELSFAESLVLEYL
jgi:hypothetical protein